MKCAQVTIGLGPTFVGSLGHDDSGVIRNFGAIDAREEYNARSG
jgi:hypothetical protein